MKYNFKVKSRLIPNLLKVIEILVERGEKFSYNGFTSTIEVDTNKEIVLNEIQKLDVEVDTL